MWGMCIEPSTFYVGVDAISIKNQKPIDLVTSAVTYRKEETRRQRDFPRLKV